MQVRKGHKRIVTSLVQLLSAEYRRCVDSIFSRRVVCPLHTGVVELLQCPFAPLRVESGRYFRCG